MSRKEREVQQKKEAKEKYLKLAAEGKTTQAKQDLARLDQIRKKREADAKKREDEKKNYGMINKLKKNQKV